MQELQSRSRILFIAILSLIFGSASFLTGTATPASAAGTNNVKPAYVTSISTGAVINATTARYDTTPTTAVVLAGQTIGFEGGLSNLTGFSQTVPVTVQLWCYGSTGKRYDTSVGLNAVTVPGDTSVSTKGLAVVRKLKGTLTVPAACVNQPALSKQNLPDGYLTMMTTQNGQGLTVGTQFTVASKLPGPGYAAAAATVVTLYRAVDLNELSIIKKNGNRYALGPNREGKYFYPTRAQAEALAAKYKQAGYGDYVVTSTQVEEGVLQAGSESISIAAEGDAYWLIEEAVIGLGEVAIL